MAASAPTERVRALTASALLLRVHTRCREFSDVPPPHAEYAKIVQHIGMGFLMMGVTSFLVKIIHIPVTNILL